MTTRRAFLTGVGAFLAAPAIVRASSIMPVRSVPTIMAWDVGSSSFEAGFFKYPYLPLQILKRDVVVPWRTS